MLKADSFKKKQIYSSNKAILLQNAYQNGNSTTTAERLTFPEAFVVKEVRTYKNDRTVVLIV